MLRALVLAAIVWALPVGAVQAPAMLHVKVVLVGPDGKAMPVSRHVLLISENPASAPPRRVVTRVDGTADLQMRPGSYTVESDRPVALQGKSYQWVQVVDIKAGRDSSLELNAANADVGVAAADTPDAAVPEAVSLEADPLTLMSDWRASVAAIWTSTTHGSAFVIDAGGLLATNYQIIGKAPSVEVQFTPALKVAGTVVAADAMHDVALVRVDPTITAEMKPLALACAQTAAPALKNGQEIYAIGAPLRGQKAMASGSAERVEPHMIQTDFRLATGSAGGPVFTAKGELVGLTSIIGDNDQGRRGEFPVVPVADVCQVVASAEQKIKQATAPGAAHLPVEAVRPFPTDALTELAKGRLGSLTPYQMSSSDFDVYFITPVFTFAAQYQAERGRREPGGRGPGGRDPGGSDPGRGGRMPDPGQGVVRPLTDFGTWTEYVADIPPVLLVRVTPKFGEGLWTKVGRAAASTQGVSIPAIKRFKSGFSKMRAFCGDKEVTPIHPFTIEQQVSETDFIHEGLYVFDPDSLGPDCAAVKLVLFSEKDPDKADSRVVDPKVIKQVADDFAPWRAQK